MQQLHVGIMSGTSLDGIDIALPALPTRTRQTAWARFASPFPTTCASNCWTCAALAAMSSTWPASPATPGPAWPQAESISTPAASGQLRAGKRHRQPWADREHHPDQGFSLQIGNPSLLAELTGINVIADFRSRDLAAGGEGAPLVPAFHHWLLGSDKHTRTLVNIGGFANLTVLRPGQSPSGFDSGPGNALMDNWALRHIGTPYDENGSWAQQGQVHDALLQRMLADPYFARTGPKSTGREYFHEAWLSVHLQHVPGVRQLTCRPRWPC
ncbi:anhydro-N-acetylmuramic acid kinase [Halopseudomonas pachastrellae]|nr:anhydro-N-acetylmuramic acid kinase [Halopseudomonas pachastrellae]